MSPFTRSVSEIQEELASVRSAMKRAREAGQSISAKNQASESVNYKSLREHEKELLHELAFASDGGASHSQMVGWGGRR